jgi:hypothetical protein
MRYSREEAAGEKKADGFHFHSPVFHQVSIELSDYTAYIICCRKSKATIQQQ